MSKHIPEARLVIDTIVEDWFDKWDRWMSGSAAVEDLKQSLWENLKLFKDLEGDKREGDE